VGHKTLNSIDQSIMRKTRRYPQNWKYITYCTAIRAGPSHGNR